MGAHRSPHPAPQRSHHRDPHLLRGGDRPWEPAADRGRGTYRQAVALLTDPERTTSGGTTAPKHLGASLYRCGKCEVEGVESTVRTAYRSIAGGVSRGGTGRLYMCATRQYLKRLADPIDAAVLAAIVTRLRSSDAADLLATEAPELTELNDQAAILRARVKRIEDDYGDGEITARQMREQIARRQAELDGATRRIAAATRSSRLAAAVGAPDPAGAFLALDLGARRAVIDTLCRVVRLPGRPGHRALDPDTVRIDWRA